MQHSYFPLEFLKSRAYFRSFLVKLCVLFLCAITYMKRYRIRYDIITKNERISRDHKN